MGAIKTMMAAEKAGVKRYIMLSSMLSLDINSWSDDGDGGGGDGANGAPVDFASILHSYLHSPIF